MTILRCNVRGINNPCKDFSIREMINKEKVEIVGLIETKLLQSTRHKVNSEWGNNPVDFLPANAIGNCGGGVLVLWNPEFFSLDNSLLGNRWIIIEGLIKPFDWRCSIVVVYGGYTLEQQTHIYSDISQIKNSLTSPIIILCYFNQILQISERKGKTWENQGMRAFRS